MFPGQIIDDFFSEVPSLVPQTSAHRHPAFPGVDELDLAFAFFLLPVGDHPDEGADPGIVEHLFRKCHDGFQPVVLDDPAPYFALP